MRRNTTIDFVRLVAAYGVIALHVPVSTRAAQWIDIVFWPLCVPFFYSVSLVYFVAGLAKVSGKLPSVFAHTWHRLIVPYLVWTAIYTGLLLAKTLLTHGNREFNWWRILFYGESAVQLYFLPTLLLLQSLALALHLLLRAKQGQRTPGWLLLTGSLVYLGWGIYCHCFGMATVGSLAGIGIYLAVAFGLAPAATSTTQPTASYLLLGGACVLGAILCNANGYTALLAGYPLILPLGGVGLLLLTLGFPMLRTAPWLAWLATASFGIYLCHVLFLEASEFALGRLHPARITYTFPVKFLEISFLFGASIACTLLLRRLPLARRLLFGEQ